MTHRHIRLYYVSKDGRIKSQKLTQTNTFEEAKKKVERPSYGGQFLACEWEDEVPPLILPYLDKGDVQMIKERVALLNATEQPKQEAPLVEPVGPKRKPPALPVEVHNNAPFNAEAAWTALKQLCKGS